MKTLALLLLSTLFACVNAPAQDGVASGLNILKEPHHRLDFENDRARIFYLKLQPGEATVPHRHNTFYAFLSLQSVTIGNEVRGRQPVITELEAGELHTSKGGFVVAERNNSTQPADLIVIEATKENPGSFATPMGGFRYHDAAYAELFQAPAMRGYTMTIAAGGRTDPHAEDCDRLIVAISDLTLREVVAGQSPLDFELKAGETKWLPRSKTESITNIGPSLGKFITLEFD